MINRKSILLERSMVNANESSQMDIDESTNPKYSINVLELLKSAHNQHGLRHRDYTRYRRYCTARLRRLYKSLKFTHGQGRFTRRTITESTITEVRYLHIVLYMAERAWSHAMEKRHLPDGPNARQRIYLLGRLRKAVKWATLFAQLCATKGDPRTSLEAEAYASYMTGTLLFEQDKNWRAALVNFRKASDVYEELGKYGDEHNQALCHARVEELEPSIKYCLHKVGDSNLQTSELLDMGEVEGPASDLFKAKLEAVMAEARSRQAASMTEFCWLGHRFPISNAKTRVSILKAQELEKDLNSSSTESLPAEKKLAIFEKIFSAYQDARSSIRNNLAAASNETTKDELNGLDKAVSAVLGYRTIERDQLRVAIAKSKFAKQKECKGDKITKPDEIVRLFDLLIQNSTDLSDLVSSVRDRNAEEVAFVDECLLKCLVFRAERCFYLAKSYSAAGKRAEAYALFCHAQSLADNALQKLKMTDNQNKDLIKDLKALSDNCRSNSCIEHATGILEEVKIPEKLSAGVSTMSLTTRAKKQEEKFLQDMLDVYESAVGAPNSKGVTRIERFPPPLQAVPCKPIVRDVAYDLIDFPSLDSRMKKDKKGIFSRLWG